MAVITIDSRDRRSFDIEYDLSVTAQPPSPDYTASAPEVRTANTAAVNTALAAMHPSGDFVFTGGLDQATLESTLAAAHPATEFLYSTGLRGPALDAATAAARLSGDIVLATGLRGPVLGKITAPANRFFFDPGILTPHRRGWQISGSGLPTYQHASAATDIGLVSRWVFMGDHTSPAAIRGRGCSGKICGLYVEGRWYFFDPTGEGPRGAGSGPDPLTTEEVPTAIEYVSGEPGGPPVSLDSIEDCTICSFGTAIHQLNGYYDGSNNFVSAGGGGNGDTSTVRNIVCADIDRFFRSDGQQNVNWGFDNLVFQWWGGAGIRPVTIFDVGAGGKLYASRISTLNPQTTLLRLGGETSFPYYYSPNNNTFRIHDFDVDGILLSGDTGILQTNRYVTLVKWAGPTPSDMSDINFDIEITGHLPGANQNFNVSKLIDLPAGKNFPVSNIRIKMTNLPTANFTSIGGGWYTPNPV